MTGSIHDGYTELLEQFKSDCIERRIVQVQNIKTVGFTVCANPGPDCKSVLVRLQGSASGSL